MITIIVNGDVFRPEHSGVVPIAVAGERILATGEIDTAALQSSGIPVNVIDASGCIVVPGLLDPHEHLIGGSGEEGFGSQTPEILLREILEGGITTVVGCLGTDTITKNMQALVAKAKGLRDQGITAHLWSGGYTVPPSTLTESVRTDMLFVEEIIGAGEIAIADHRSSAAGIRDLARLVRDAHVGGMLSGKCGVTHFHVGDEPERLATIRELVDAYGVHPEWVYPTHVSRNEELLAEAAELSRLGVTVDMDTVDSDLPERLNFFLERGGDPDHLTVSSDAAINSPRNLLAQVRRCVHAGIVDLQTALRLVTRNTARILKMKRKGRLEPGADADILILAKETLEVRHVIARGNALLTDGEVTVSARCLSGSNRVIELYGPDR